MYINIEVRTDSADTLHKISQAIQNEPTRHSNISCGYANISIVYNCQKNEMGKIKSYWKSVVPDCLVVSV